MRAGSAASIFSITAVRGSPDTGTGPSAGVGPGAIVSLLRSMQERGDLLRDEADGAWMQGPALDWRALPARVEAVIEARVEHLDNNVDLRHDFGDLPFGFRHMSRKPLYGHESLSCREISAPA